MLTIKPGSLTLDQLRLAYFEVQEAELDPAAISAIATGAAAVERIAEKGDAAYGINTGFGRLANTRIARDQLELLQRNLVLSHAVGIGDPLPVPVVRLMILLKVASLARGYSGITPAVVDALLALLNQGAIPVIPSKGSVGASGDLAPLAHMAAVLLGVGEVWIDGRRRPAREGLALAGLEPMTLRAKEGLALLNGTQCSTAIALAGLFKVERLFGAAIVSGSMSVDAAAGSLVPF
ncbi:MAG: aromatic amino acid lyase, partial [Actinomycetota bacterium]|nr:aromatic amino acid lyase [Actinomycetota bacterium]